jgi:hypothetical protein
MTDIELIDKKLAFILTGAHAPAGDPGDCRCRIAYRQR